MKSEVVALRSEPASSSLVALAALSLATLMSSLGTSIANVALPTLAQFFDATFSNVQWVVLAYLLASTALVVVVGRLGDVVGQRRLLLAGISVFALASLGCAVAPTLSLLIAARALQGVGAAVMLALTMAVATTTVSTTRAGTAIGLLGAMTAVGTALGPSIGGVLIAVFNWRALFFLNVPLGLLTLVLAHHSLPDDRAQLQTRQPFRLAMFQNVLLRRGLLMLALVSTVMMATLVVGPFYLSRALNLDAAAVGFTMSVGPIVAALTSIPAGRIADRFGSRRTTVFGLCGIVGGSTALALGHTSYGVAGYLLPIALMTAGYAVFQTANNTALMTEVSRGERGVISGLLNLARNLGLICGASVMGAVFAHWSGSPNISISNAVSVATGMRATFAVAAALVLLALVIAAQGHDKPGISSTG
ncbi:MAG: MFS transporter [Gemmatimonadaceae bacterium]